MRVLTYLLAGVAGLALASDPAHAAPGGAKPRAADVRLECKVVFGPGAEGKVRYEVRKGKASFTAAVEAGPEDEDDGPTTGPEDVPLFAAGDTLPVTVGGAYLAGTIVLGQDGAGLEGALRFEGKARGRTVRPFPADFPALSAGTAVTLGAEPCLLQDRGRPRPKPRRG